MSKIRWGVWILVLAAGVLTHGCTTWDQAPGQVVPRSDRALVTDLTQRLMEDYVTSEHNIGVSAQAGIVTLRGWVDDPMVRARAVAVALGTEGVREVRDQLQPR